jgi:lysophospholipase L1-like esterase
MTAKRAAQLRQTGRRVAAAIAGVAIFAGLLGGVAWAATIVGTPKSDVLKGSPRADKIYGKAGNDRLYGKAGNDRLYGNGGKDLLVGGRGADLLVCGAGRDVAVADKNDKATRGCEVVQGLPKPPPPPPAPPPGLYLALGASITAGEGASVGPKAWVNLYFRYLASNGSGVTELRNRAESGASSTTIRSSQLPRVVASINESSDTLRVTVDIGRNDGCENANDPGCPVRDNLRAILTTLNEALDRDPGDEMIQIMEFFNSDIATPRESETRRYLLGSDSKIDCSGTGSSLGLNDLIHCVAMEMRVLPVDLLPAFDAAGPSFLAGDHRHPNDAGHRAIAQAFGGAAP